MIFIILRYVNLIDFFKKIDKYKTYMNNTFKINIINHTLVLFSFYYVRCSTLITF